MRLFATKVWLSYALEQGSHDIKTILVGEGSDPKTLYCEKIILKGDHLTVHIHGLGDSIYIPMGNVAGTVVISGAKAGKGTSSVIKPIPDPANV